MTAFEGIDDVVARLADVGYIADRELATTVYLAQALEKPLLLEGEAASARPNSRRRSRRRAGLA